jgi:hypothetical protein
MCRRRIAATARAFASFATMMTIGAAPRDANEKPARR